MPAQGNTRNCPVVYGLYLNHDRVNLNSKPPFSPVCSWLGVSFAAQGRYLPHDILIHWCIRVCGVSKIPGKLVLFDQWAFPEKKSRVKLKTGLFNLYISQLDHSRKLNILTIGCMASIVPY